MSGPTRRLILMRHGKSDWSSGAEDDHARPLNERGRQDSPAMGSWLVAQGWAPDAVVCSDSTRTWETWERMAGAFSAPPALVVGRELYHAGLSELTLHARTWAPGWTTVLALGHNPGWEEAVHTLTSQHEAMKTASCALLLGKGASWPEALLGAWELHRAMRPRSLPTR